MHDSNLTETKELIAKMAREGSELKAATGGGIADAMADWLGPQYLLVREMRYRGCRAGSGGRFCD